MYGPESSDSSDEASMVETIESKTAIIPKGDPSDLSNDAIWKRMTKLAIETAAKGLCEIDEEVKKLMPPHAGMLALHPRWDKKGEWVSIDWELRKPDGTLIKAATDYDTCCTFRTLKQGPKKEDYWSETSDGCTCRTSVRSIVPPAAPPPAVPAGFNGLVLRKGKGGTLIGQDGQSFTTHELASKILSDMGPPPRASETSSRTKATKATSPAAKKESARELKSESSAAKTDFVLGTENDLEGRSTTFTPEDSDEEEPRDHPSPEGHVRSSHVFTPEGSDDDDEAPV